MVKHIIQRFLPLALSASLLLSPVTALAAESQDLGAPLPGMEEAVSETEAGQLEDGQAEAVEDGGNIQAAPEEEPAPTAAPETPQPTAEPDEPAPPEEGASEASPSPEEDGEQSASADRLLLGSVFRSSGQVLRMGTHEAYMPGVQGAYFFPNQAMTRADIAQTLYNLLAEKPEEASCSFSDVDEEDESYEVIAAISSLGLMTGAGNGKFNPGGRLSRAEFAVILGRCFEAEEGEIDYSDVEEGHWAYEAIASATAKGWMSGPGDGSFQPGKNITRCEVAKVLNVALERTGEGFASDEEQEFKDVPTTHWAFQHIAEAADPNDLPEPTPTPAPTPAPSPSTAPSGFAVGKQVRVTSDNGLNVRSGPGSNYDPPLTAVAYHAVMTITDISHYPWLGVQTASGVRGYSLADYLELYTPSTNPTPGPSQNGTLSASSLTLSQYQSARLDARADGSISSMRWSSSNPDVAVVGHTVEYRNGGNEHGAIVYGKAPGTATLTFSDGQGNARASCTVTVTAPEAVRFAYAEEISVMANQEFHLTAITDAAKEEVRFEIVDGPAKGSYTTNSYESQTQASSYGLPSNSIRVFKRAVTFGLSGVYTLRAYSSTNGSYSTDYREFQVVVSSSSSYTEATFDARNTVSKKLVDSLERFEGFVQEIEEDRLSPKNPTVGYGYVVPVNTNFYDNMTKTEAYSFLVEKVNGGSFAKTVESFRRANNIKMSQAQFDALTSFIYNVGGNALNVNLNETPLVILNMVAPPDASPSKPYRGVVNISDVKMYASTNYTSQILARIPNGASVTVIGVQQYRTSTKQEVWYKAMYGSTVGWIASGHVKLDGDFQHDLTYADTTSLANEFLQWHISGAGHTPGLLMRRMSECKIFFFGNYDDHLDSPNYTTNTYGFRFPDSAGCIAAGCKNYDRRP